MLVMKGDSDEVVDVEVEGEANASSETVVLVVVVVGVAVEEEDRSRSSKVDSCTETVPAAGVVVFFLLEDLAEFWKAFCRLAPEEKARATAGVEE